MKKIASVLCSCAMVLSLCVSTVLAKPSASANGQVVSFTVDGEKRDDIVLEFEVESTFNDVTDSAVLDLINQLNSGVKPATAFEGVKIQNETDLDLSKALLLTKVQNLIAKKVSNGEIVYGLKNVGVTWEVPNLTKDVGQVYVLHYSVDRNVWEILNPTNVDYQAKTLSADLKDMSPVAVLYVPGSAVGDKKDDNVETGDKTNIALYAGLAVVALAVVGVVAYTSKKKRSH